MNDMSLKSDTSWLKKVVSVARRWKFYEFYVDDELVIGVYWEESILSDVMLLTAGMSDFYSFKKILTKHFPKFHS